ncbi:MAG: ABC transporter permease subunit [Actinomycetota bacterium]|nr:ABC transporter permease subunit [Actinomycetota bacterium]
MRSIFSQVWPRVAAIGGLLTVWWLVSQSGFLEDYQLPPPGDVGRSLVDDWVSTPPGATEGIFAALQKSLLRLAIGMGISVIVGTVIGAAMAGSQFIQRSVGSLMTGLQALPSIAWLPLAILWFGLNERAIMFVVIIAAIPAVAIAAASSIRLVPPLLIRAGRTLGAKGWELQRSIVLPAAVPGYVAGLQQAWALAWRALMAGELISTGAQGLGHLMDVERQALHTDTVIAVMVVIVIVGMLVEFGFGAWDRRVRGRRGLLLTTG